MLIWTVSPDCDPDYDNLGIELKFGIEGLKHVAYVICFNNVDSDSRSGLHVECNPIRITKVWKSNWIWFEFGALINYFFILNVLLQQLTVIELNNS